MSIYKTEELVKKCFLENWIRLNGLGDPESIKHIARAARKFAREEQKEKIKYPKHEIVWHNIGRVELRKINRNNK